MISAKNGRETLCGTVMEIYLYISFLSGIDNVVKFMMFNMKKIGCPLNGKSFICSPCEQKVGGHFSPDNGVS